MRLGVFAFSLLLWTACAGDGYLALPDLPAAESLVFSVSSDGRLFAATPDEAPSLDVPRGSRVHLIAYDRTLEALDLVSGPIEPKESAPCERLAPKRVLVTEADVAGIWEETDIPVGIADRLVLDRRRRCLPCLELEQSAVPIVSSEQTPAQTAVQADSMAWFDQRRILVSLGVQQFSVVSRQGAQTVTGCEGLGHLEAVHRVSEGHYWLAGAAGRVVEIQIDPTALTCEVLTSTAAPVPSDAYAKFKWMAGSPDAVDPELYLLNRGGALWRFDGERFEHLYTADLQDMHVGSGSPDGGLVWLGPGEVAFHIGPPKIVFWGADHPPRVETVDLAFGAVGQVISLAEIPKTGLVAGAADGTLLARRAEFSWESLGVSSVFAPVSSLVYYRERLFAMVKGGAVVQYSEAFGFCDEPYQLTNGTENLTLSVSNEDSLVVLDVVQPAAGRAEPSVWLSVSGD